MYVYFGVYYCVIHDFVSINDDFRRTSLLIRLVFGYYCAPFVAPQKSFFVAGFNDSFFLAEVQSIQYWRAYTRHLADSVSGFDSLQTRLNGMMVGGSFIKAMGA